ncbi:MAG: VTT domain-containing protein [Actinobacteria bacterium]|nr:VTT domain-containing protein [Actinomycetota bacterium]
MPTALLALDFLDPKKILQKGGIALLAAIVFAESGLFVGFFLPGDSLLFIAGFLTSGAARTAPGFERLFDASGGPLPALPVVLVVVFLAAVAGDQVGYLFGRRVGPALFSRPDSRLFRQEHVAKAHDFFERHGSKTIVLARFVPIVRTFAPIVAGVSKMRYRTFVSFNLVGGLLWAVGVTLLGRFLGEVKLVRDNIEIALIAIVAVSVLPMVIEVVRHRRARRARQAAPVPGDAVTADEG